MPKSVLDSDRRTAGDVQSQTLRAGGGVGGGDCRDGPGDKSTQHAHGVLRNLLNGGGGRHVGGRGHVSARVDGRDGRVFADSHRHER